MKISPINNFYQYKPSFKSTTRTTYYSHTEGEFSLPRYNRDLNETSYFKTDASVKMVSSNSTQFFRKDFPWDNIGKVFEKKFPTGQVCIHDFACSDGSEAFSLIIALNEQLGEKRADRFFPIMASDIDPEIIRMASSGKINATADDIYEIEKNIKKGSICKYFHVTQLSGNKFILSPKEILLKNVVFERKSIADGLDDVDKDNNNIILCRNFWKYLKKDDLAESTWKLAHKLDDKTLLMIGSFDCDLSDSIPFFMKEMGLERTKKHNETGVILKYNKELANASLLSNKDEWKKLIEKKHWNYIPRYLKA